MSLPLVTESLSILATLAEAEEKKPLGQAKIRAPKRAAKERRRALPSLGRKQKARLGGNIRRTFRGKKGGVGQRYKKEMLAKDTDVLAQQEKQRSIYRMISNIASNLTWEVLIGRMRSASAAQQFSSELEQAVMRNIKLSGGRITRNVMRKEATSVFGLADKPKPKEVSDAFEKLAKAGYVEITARDVDKDDVDELEYLATQPPSEQVQARIEFLRNKIATADATAVRLVKELPETAGIESPIVTPEVAATMLGGRERGADVVHLREAADWFNRDKNELKELLAIPFHMGFTRRGGQITQEMEDAEEEDKRLQGELSRSGKLNYRRNQAIRRERVLKKRLKDEQINELVALLTIERKDLLKRIAKEKRPTKKNQAALKKLEAKLKKARDVQATFHKDLKHARSVLEAVRKEAADVKARRAHLRSVIDAGKKTLEAWKQKRDSIVAHLMKGGEILNKVVIRLERIKEDGERKRKPTILYKTEQLEQDIKNLYREFKLAVDAFPPGAV